MYILAIETSCDETAASVIETDGSSVQILSNIIASQILIHKQFGGVFPEIASRAHAEKIIPVVKEALKDLPAGEAGIKPDIIAVTEGPGLIGSLLIGVNFAKTYAYVNNLPIIGINHWLGHIYSNWAEKPYPEFPALILIVSGGHTGLVLMKSHTDIIPLGETLDDAAGEAFDKVAKLLGLDYPGGPAISAEVEKYQKDSHPVVIPAKAGIQSCLDSKSCRRPVWNDNINFPRSMLNKPGYDFSFSGLKTAVLYKVQELTKKYSLDVIRPIIAYEFQQTVIDILVGKTIQAAYEFKPKSICLCGGVSANYELRQQMQKAVLSFRTGRGQDPESSRISYHVPPIILSTDNAAMIGIAAAYHLDNKKTWKDINADSNLKL